MAGGPAEAAAAPADGSSTANQAAPKVVPKATPKAAGSKRWAWKLAGVALLAAVAYKACPYKKKEVIGFLKEGLLQMEVLRGYGLPGWVAFCLMYSLHLICCLPGTILWDVALGSIFGTIFGTAGSIAAKCLAALLCLPS